MTEIPARFGPEDALVGVYSPAASATPWCCLVFNAGLMPRVGPNRLNVKLARSLAAAGIPVLRFDLAGLGDSAPRANALSWREQAVQDIRAAVDFMLASQGHTRFLLFGICSGAENALNATLADERIVGAFMVDGFWYRTLWTRPVRVWRRFRMLGTKGFLRALVRRLLPRAKPVTSPHELQFFPGESTANPPRAEYAAHMNKLMARGAQVFVLYTSAAERYVSYSNQLRDAFSREPFSRHIRSEFRPDLDHTGVSVVAQNKMIAMVREWALGVAKS